MTRLEQLRQALHQVMGEQVQLVEHVGELTLTISPSHWLQTCMMLRDHELLRFEQALDLCGVDYLTYGGVSVGLDDVVPQALGREATGATTSSPQQSSGGAEGAHGAQSAASSGQRAVDAAHTGAHDDAHVNQATVTRVSGLPSQQPSQFPGRFAVVVQLMSVSHNWRLRIRAFAENNDFPVVPSLVNVWNSLNWFEREAFDLFGIVFEGHPDLRRILTDYGFIGHPFRKDFPVIGHVEMIYDPESKRVVYQPVTIEHRENIPRVIREEDYGTGRDTIDHDSLEASQG